MRSGMTVRVIDRQAFGGGGVVEGLIGRDQGDGAGAFLPMVAADFERHGELHCVVGAQRVRSPQALGLLQQGGRHSDDGISPGDMLLEAAEDRRRFGGGDRLALAAAGDRRR